MLDELLEKKLKDLREDEILVVMDDGLAFLGTLDEFDKKTLVLKNVYQGPAKDIDWEELKEPEEMKEDAEEKRKVGFIEWTAINLEEVYIRTEHVIRIWRWPVEQGKGESERDTRIQRKAVYSKKKDIADERAASMGDIPETFSDRR